MGVKADIINKVAEVLRDAVASGSLTYVKTFVFGNLRTGQTLGGPFIVVSLPDVDLASEDWQETTNRKREDYRVAVRCSIEAPSDLAFPYGKSGDVTKRGILTFLDDVQNEIENNYNVIRAANTRVIDFQSVVTNHQKIDDSSWWHATIILAFRSHFQQGDR